MLTTSGRTAVGCSDPLIDHPLLATQNILSIYTPRVGGSRIDGRNWSTAS